MRSTAAPDDPLTVRVQATSVTMSASPIRKGVDRDRRGSPPSTRRIEKGVDAVGTLAGRQDRERSVATRPNRPDLAARNGMWGRGNSSTP